MIMYVDQGISYLNNFDTQFPSFNGKVIKQPQNKDWAPIVASNQDQVSGAALNFLAPIEEDGVHIIQFHNEKVMDEV